MFVYPPPHQKQDSCLLYFVLPRWHSVKNLPANVGVARDVCLIPGSGRFPGGHGNPLQYLVWKISWTEEPKVAKRQG